MADKAENGKSQTMSDSFTKLAESTTLMVMGRMMMIIIAPLFGILVMNYSATATDVETLKRDVALLQATDTSTLSRVGTLENADQAQAVTREQRRSEYDKRFNDVRDITTELRYKVTTMEQILPEINKNLSALNAQQTLMNQEQALMKQQLSGISTQVGSISGASQPIQGEPSRPRR